MTLRGLAKVVASASALALAVASPSVAATKKLKPVSRDSIGSFTPAATDARLAAVLARSGMSNTGFRFTPASSVRVNRSVTVAVRARTSNRPASSQQTALVAPTPAALTPIAYNLGVAIGWRKFALLGDVEKVDIAGIGRREALDVGLSYTNKRFSTRVQLGADRATGSVPQLLGPGSGYSVDVGTSYAFTRNFDVTAGLRYRAQTDALRTELDGRRDSQAVYVGTAFRF